MSLNVNEYGRVLRINTGIDLTGATLILTLKSPSPYVEYKQRNNLSGVQRGLVDISIDSDTVFLANQYAEYKFLIGDLDVSGIWSAKIEAYYTSPSQCLITDYINFEVKR